MSNNALPGVASIIGAGLSAQGQRLSLIASNLANADSVTAPGGQPYRALEPVFEAVAATSDGSNGPSSVAMAGVVESAAPARLRYDPTSPFANQAGYVAGSNVSTAQQMVDLIDATQSYQAQIAVLGQNEHLEQAMVQSFIA